MRSLIVAPADEKRLAEALASGADGLVIDLASPRPTRRPAARAAAARFLEEARARGGGPALIVGLSALDSGEAEHDLDAVMAGAPDAILLPRSFGGASVQQFSAKLAVREAELAPCRRRDAHHRRRRYGAVAVRHGELSRLERAADRASLGRRVLARRHRRRALSRPHRAASPALFAWPAT